MKIRASWRKGALALSFALLQPLATNAAETFRLPPVQWGADYVVRGQSEMEPTPAMPMDVSPSDHQQPSGSSGGESCTTCNACDDCCDSCCIGNWWDNTEIFIGGDAFASLGDSITGGFNDSFGAVTGFNTGFALGESRVRGQFGASYGAYDFKGRSAFGLEQSSLEEQVFITTGLYKRSDIEYGDAISWGVVYDALITDNYGLAADELNLGQVRGIFGYALNECHEVGMWGTLNVMDDDSLILGELRPMKQANAYWKQNWQYGATTSLYVGAMDNADVGDWVLGFTGRAPMSERMALYGGATYVTPSSSTGAVGSVEDQWNVFAGVVFFPGGKSVSRTVSGDAGLPLLPVANNSSLLITN